MNHEFHELHELNNEQRFEDLKDFEPTSTTKTVCERFMWDLWWFLVQRIIAPVTFKNHEFHELHELNNEQRFEDLKDFEPTDNKDYTYSLFSDISNLHLYVFLKRIAVIVRNCP